MPDIDSIGLELVRQGQDLVGVIRGAGRGIGAGGGERAGSNPELVQIHGTGGLYVELICGGLGEAAGAHQIAVDEVIELAAGEGNPHGKPLVFVAVV